MNTNRFVMLVFAAALLLASCGPAIHTTTTVRYEERVAPPPPPPEPEPVGYDMFYRELSPYGQWIDYPGEGYVWAPRVDRDFRPYASNGHWVYSDYGWTWDSNYPWGWAAFHYGRWMFEDEYGWIWVPGNEWAPAWVTWGSSEGYYGWAPLAPHININMSFGERSWNPPVHYWNFVPREHMTQTNINNYVINQRNNVTVVNNITRNVTIINNYNHIDINNNNNRSDRGVYNQGPQIRDVEMHTRSNIQAVHINESGRPGSSTVSNNQMNIYRPSIHQNDPNSGNRPAPQRIEAYKRPIANGNPVQQQDNGIHPGDHRNVDQHPGDDRKDGNNAAPSNGNTGNQQQGTNGQQGNNYQKPAGGAAPAANPQVINGNQTPMLTPTGTQNQGNNFQRPPGTTPANNNQQPGNNNFQRPPGNNPPNTNPQGINGHQNNVLPPTGTPQQGNNNFQRPLGTNQPPNNNFQRPGSTNPGNNQQPNNNFQRPIQAAPNTIQPGNPQFQNAGQQPANNQNQRNAGFMRQDPSMRRTNVPTQNASQPGGAQTKIQPAPVNFSRPGSTVVPLKQVPNAPAPAKPVVKPADQKQAPKSDKKNE